MHILINSSLKNHLGVNDKKIKKILISVFENFKKYQDSYLSINLVGEKKIKTLNKFYRNRDSVTDVISFALHDYTPFLGEKEDLGDIFICLSQVKRQAKENEINFEEEFVRILTHGVLHLLGFDHKNKKEEEKMFIIQERLVRKNI